MRMAALLTEAAQLSGSAAAAAVAAQAIQGLTFTSVCRGFVTAGTPRPGAPACSKVDALGLNSAYGSQLSSASALLSTPQCVQHENLPCRRFKIRRINKSRSMQPWVALTCRPLIFGPPQHAKLANISVITKPRKHVGHEKLTAAQCEVALSPVIPPARPQNVPLSRPEA